MWCTPQHQSMQSEILIAVVGLAGTVIGAGVATLGTIRATRLNGRAQFDAQMAQARREAFYTCSQVFIARQAALHEYMDLLFKIARDPHEPAPDPRTRRAQWQTYCQQKEDLKRLNLQALQALGAVAVVGAPHVWRKAEFTHGISELAYEWLESRFHCFREEGQWIGGHLTRNAWREIHPRLTSHNEHLHDFLDMCNAMLSPKPRGWLTSAPIEPAIRPSRWVIAEDR